MLYQSSRKAYGVLVDEYVVRAMNNQRQQGSLRNIETGTSMILKSTQTTALLR